MRQLEWRLWNSQDLRKGISIDSYLLNVIVGKSCISAPFLYIGCRTYNERYILDSHLSSVTVSVQRETRTLILDDTFTNANSGIRGHLNLFQMSSLETQLSQLPCPVSRWVITWHKFGSYPTLDLPYQGYHRTRRYQKFPRPLERAPLEPSGRVSIPLPMSSPVSRLVSKSDRYEDAL